MNRVALTLAAIASTSAMAAVPAGGAVGSRHCHAVGSSVGRLTATGVTCSLARRIVTAEVRGTPPPNRFRCHSVRNPAGATVTCRSGARRVTFQIAD